MTNVSYNEGIHHMTHPRVVQCVLYILHYPHLELRWFKIEIKPFAWHLVTGYEILSH